MSDPGLTIAVQHLLSYGMVDDVEISHQRRDILLLSLHFFVYDIGWYLMQHRDKCKYEAEIDLWKRRFKRRTAILIKWMSEGQCPPQWVDCPNEPGYESPEERCQDCIEDALNEAMKDQCDGDGTSNACWLAAAEEYVK